MELPKKLNVFGQRFKVKVQPLTGILGLCDRSTATIYVESDQTIDAQLHTLIHELGHAVFGRISLVQGVPHEIEEVIVDSLATAILENLDVIPKGYLPVSPPSDDSQDQ